jgi:hypothetical protein
LSVNKFEEFSKLSDAETSVTLTERVINGENCRRIKCGIEIGKSGAKLWSSLTTPKEIRHQSVPDETRRDTPPFS